MAIGNVNVNESYREVRDQSPVEDGTATGINFKREYQEYTIPVAFEDQFFKDTGWEESRNNGFCIKTNYKENLVLEGRPRNYFNQQPQDILDRHGHVIEFDSSKNAERIVIHHRSGSYYEMLVDGTIQTKARGGRYIVTIQNHDEYIKGRRRVTVKGDDHILIESNKYEQIKGNLIEEVKQNVMKEVEKSMSVKIKEDLYEFITNLVERTAKEIINNADKITDNTSRHNLSSNYNNRKVNNYLLCPFKGALHSTQSEVFCGPGAAGPKSSSIDGTDLGEELSV